jgi:hypothetical protein
VCNTDRIARCGSLFPVRVDTDTNFFGHEDVMQRAQATARAMYLRLLDLHQRLNQNSDVRICSPLGAIENGVFVPVPIHEYRQASVKSLAIDTVTLSMIGYSAFEGIRDFPGYPGKMAVQIQAIPTDQPLQLPYELIRAAWLVLSSCIICVKFAGETFGPGESSIRSVDLVAGCQAGTVWKLWLILLIWASLRPEAMLSIGL